VFEIAGVRPAASIPSATQVKLFENKATRFRAVVDASVAGAGCGQLMHYLQNATEDGMEPLWRGMLSIAKACVDSEKAVVWLSNKHPYPQQRMRQKLHEIKGPYPCMKFDSENPGLCTSCKHWGKITNPLALGRELLTDNAPKELVLTPASVSPDVHDQQIKVTRPEPPRGYNYGINGGVYGMKMVVDDEGKKERQQVMLLPFNMFVADVLSQEGVHSIHLMAEKPEGVMDVTIPSRSIVSKDDALKALAEQNILASNGASNDKLLVDYVRACVEQAGTEKAAVKVPSSCGWQEDNSFVFAGRIFTKDAKPLRVPMPGLENLTTNMEPKGTLEGWRTYVNMLIEHKQYAQLTLMLAGACAPLMRYTGLFGLTFHCASTESGTGKSMALEAAASVWGHPVHYRTGKGTSPVAMQQRLGLLHTLPLITDEITSKNRADFEWMPAFLLDMSEGRGKERMEASSNKERLNLSTWMTTCLMSSNTNIVDYLTGERRHASEGELRRLLEFVLNDKLVWTPEEVEVIKSLHDNYGVAGYKIADYLAKNEDTLGPLVTRATQQMFKEFHSTNDERFWTGGAGCIVAMGLLFNDRHAGIINLPMKGIIDYLHSVVLRMRASMKLGARDAEDILNSYIRDFYGNFVVTRREKGLLSIELGGGSGASSAIDWREMQRSKVCGRVEHGETVGHIDFYIEERLIKAYCSTMSFGYDDFKTQMELRFHVRYLKKDMLSKTKGPAMRVNTMLISRRMDALDDDENSDPLSVAAA
jgi:hypothetical protein